MCPQIYLLNREISIIRLKEMSLTLPSNLKCVHIITEKQLLYVHVVHKNGNYSLLNFDLRYTDLCGFSQSQLTIARTDQTLTCLLVSQNFPKCTILSYQDHTKTDRLFNCQNISRELQLPRLLNTATLKRSTLLLETLALELRWGRLFYFFYYC